MFTTTMPPDIAIYALLSIQDILNILCYNAYAYLCLQIHVELLVKHSMSMQACQSFMRLISIKYSSSNIDNNKFYLIKSNIICKNNYRIENE